MTVQAPAKVCAWLRVRVLGLRPSSMGPCGSCACSLCTHSHLTSDHPRYMAMVLRRVPYTMYAP